MRLALSAAPVADGLYPTNVHYLWRSGGADNGQRIRRDALVGRGGPVRVKTRAVIWIDDLLIVAAQRRRGRTELSLPGGRVNKYESVLDALKREVAEETGLEIIPGRLVYVSEIVESVRTHDLELIFLAETSGVPRLNGFRVVDVNAGERPPVRPPILEQIASDAATGWRNTPRWLGNLGNLEHSGELPS
jgi:8-oxo-dGTP pyrophosphatase MutT (NUDIX family)